MRYTIGYYRYGHGQILDEFVTSRDDSDPEPEAVLDQWLEANEGRLKPGKYTLKCSAGTAYVDTI